MIKVLVIDDAYFLRFTLANFLNSDPSMKAFTAKDYEEAMQKLKLHPDVIILSIDMKRISCLDILHNIMDAQPVPVIITSSTNDLSSHEVLTAFEYGAFDFIAKPKRNSKIMDMKEELIALVKTAASVEIKKLSLEQRGKIGRFPQHSNKIVVLGASSGGPTAIEFILKSLPKGFPAFLLVVQHMPPGFTKTFAERLNKRCAISVKEAEQGERMVQGKALVAQGGFALEILSKDNGAKVRLKKEREELMPCIDTALKSIAQVFKDDVIAVILTGMGQDGSNGAEEVKKYQGVVIAQDERTSVVFGMPKAVIERGHADHVLSLDRIPKKIMELM